MKATANENVVYILGAGFSAQFGLPVMSNFLEKSKDMYALKGSTNLRGTDVDFFNDVYLEIDKLRRCKDFYASDMTNIEEILSLFEMGKLIGKKSKQTINFQNFIAEVIKYYTPTQEKIKQSEWIFRDLCTFILHIYGRTSVDKYDVAQTLPEYSVLTFNYDALLENVLQYCKMSKQSAYSYFNFSRDNNRKTRDNVPYIKLHGDVIEPKTIVTPTWKKAFGNNLTWKNAGTLLAEANHIRIIGYSLPITDSYLKYFLKWGAAHEQNLKSIDVICLDDDQHSVENRYREFIHHKLNFYNKSTGDYLEEIKNGIENAHQNLFQKPQSSRVQFF